MSRAFIREDVEPFERPVRVRSSSGLPPGAVNYITLEGVNAMRCRLSMLEEDPEGNAKVIEHITEVLQNAKIVEHDPGGDDVTFGALVTVEDPEGRRAEYRVVGADEIDFDSRNVSWVSEFGRELLAARLGRYVTLPGIPHRVWKIVKID